jgi:hypothetical protein
MSTAEQKIIAAQVQKCLRSVHRALGIEKPKDDLVLSELKREPETVSKIENRQIYDEECARQKRTQHEQRKRGFAKMHA